MHSILPKLYPDMFMSNIHLILFTSCLFQLKSQILEQALFFCFFFFFSPSSLERGSLQYIAPRRAEIEVSLAQKWSIELKTKDYGTKLSSHLLNHLSGINNFSTIPYIYTLAIV